MFDGGNLYDGGVQNPSLHRYNITRFSLVMVNIAGLCFDAIWIFYSGEMGCLMGMACPTMDFYCMGVIMVWVCFKNASNRFILIPPLLSRSTLLS